MRKFYPQTAARRQRMAVIWNECDAARATEREECHVAAIGSQQKGRKNSGHP